MSKKRKTEKNSYGIVGLGRFGFALALELGRAGADILVIDADEEKVRELREYTENAYVTNCLDKKTLEETGIGSCDVVILCIGEAMDVSILTTLHLVGMGIPHVIAKANSYEHGVILEKLGAEVVFPEHDMALRLANRLEASRMLDYIQLSEKLNISKLMAPEKIVGRTVIETGLRASFGINIIAVENSGNLVEAVTPGYTFRRGDILYVSGSRNSIQALSEWAE